MPDDRLCTAAVMICTLIGAQGIDTKNVHRAIHIGAPGSIEEWRQADGRTCRPDGTAFGVVYTNGDDFKAGESFDIDVKKTFETEDTCLHASIDRVLGDEVQSLTGSQAGHCCKPCYDREEVKDWEPDYFFPHVKQRGKKADKRTRPSAKIAQFSTAIKAYQSENSEPLFEDNEVFDKMHRSYIGVDPPMLQLFPDWAHNMVIQAYTNMMDMEQVDYPNEHIRDTTLNIIRRLPDIPGGENCLIYQRTFTLFRILLF